KPYSRRLLFAVRGGNDKTAGRPYRFDKPPLILSRGVRQTRSFAASDASFQAWHSVRIIPWRGTSRQEGGRLTFTKVATAELKTLIGNRSTFAVDSRPACEQELIAGGSGEPIAVKGSADNATRASSRK